MSDGLTDGDGKNKFLQFFRFLDEIDNSAKQVWAKNEQMIDYFSWL